MNDMNDIYNIREIWHKQINACVNVLQERKKCLGFYNKSM